jgi:predicted lipoprotein
MAITGKRIEQEETEGTEHSDLRFLCLLLFNSMNRFLLGTFAVAGAVVVCWFFPLFRVIPLERATKEKSAATFSATGFAERFWGEQLLKSLEKAVKADTLLPAIQQNAAEAKRKFGRSVGVGESYTYFLSGKGRVLAASEDEIALVLSPSATNADVVLQSGLLFGNALRDGTGLLNVNDYPNSQDFNAISEALNHLVETRVQPKLREQAKVGATVRFVGCAEVNDESTDLKPLKVVPIQADVE